MAVLKRRLLYALLSMHSLLVFLTTCTILYTLWLSWDEPALYGSVFVLFWAYYFFGGVIDTVIYANDSALHCRLVSDMPCLVKGYRPTPYLINANLQTLFAAAGRPAPPVRFTRELVSGVYPDGEVCRLDWSLAKQGASTTTNRGSNGFDPLPPVCMVFHGLTGGSDDSNMHYITQEINRMGWDVVIPVRRGCGDEATITVPKFYAYGGIEDTEHVVNYVAKKCAGRPLFGVGISAGSNVLANYLGMLGPESRIAGAVSIANGYCWEKGTAAIREHHPVWDAIMSGIVLHTLFSRHKIFLDHDQFVSPAGSVREAGGGRVAAGGGGAPISTSTSSPSSSTCSTPVVDPVLTMQRFGSQRDVDEYVSRRLHGFDSLQAFYRHQSCEYRLDKICVPTLFLNALDDPLAHHQNIPVEALRRNPMTLLVTTACGGHLGWAEGWFPFRNQPTWMDYFIVEALESLHRLEMDRQREEACRKLSSVGRSASSGHHSALRRYTGEADDVNDALDVASRGGYLLSPSFFMSQAALHAHQHQAQSPSAQQRRHQRHRQGPSSSENGGALHRRSGGATSTSILPPTAPESAGSLGATPTKCNGKTPLSAAAGVPRRTSSDSFPPLFDDSASDSTGPTRAPLEPSKGAHAHAR